MKILELSNYYPEHPGGIEIVAWNLVKRWRQHHKVRWMACDAREHPHVCAEDDIPISANNFTEEHLGFPYPIPLGKSIFQIFKQAKWCDAVHIHDCLYLANIFAVIASRLYNKPLLITQHVALVPYHEAYKNVLQRLAYDTLGKFVLKHAETVIFISERVKDWFAARVECGQNAILIPNGIDRHLFYPPVSEERQTFRANLGFSPSDSVCLYVGRFIQKKGIHLINKIARSRLNLRWVMIGKGEINPRDWNLPNVQVLPPQPQAALRAYYGAADLFVLPSAGEGFPLVVQEALSCGLPTAVSQEIADYLPDAPLVKLNTTALPTIYETLDKLFAQPKHLWDLRNAAVEYSKRWDWDNVVRQYEELLIKLTSRH